MAILTMFLDWIGSKILPDDLFVEINWNDDDYEEL